MNSNSEPIIAFSRNFDTALAKARQAVTISPQQALQHLAEVFSQPSIPVEAMILAARAHRLSGAISEAHAMLADLLMQQPQNADALREIGMVHLMRHELPEAQHVLERAIAIDDGDIRVWTVLAEVHRLLGDETASEKALRAAIAAAKYDEEGMAAAAALVEDRLPDAEQLLRARLREYPTDVTAIRMMAELATRLGRLADADKLLRRALEIAPFFEGARELLARNLQQLNRPVEALEETERLLELAPEDLSVQMLKASLLVKTGDQEGARVIYQAAVDLHPRQARTWMSLGHVLKTLGRQQEGVAAYKQAIEQQPSLGEAWWSLANLKTVQFSADDIAAMQQGLDEASDDEDRLHLHFALGKACEDAGRYEEAFKHWQEGNRIRRQSLPYRAEDIHQDCLRATEFFTTAILSGLSGWIAADPIFIVGMPRSGSTLVEQILASHSQIEGTMELPDIMEIVARVRGEASKAGKSYPAVLSELSASELRRLGEEYLDRTAVHRKLGRPYFIDKMPNNWLHAGFIRMILPHAHIIDTRRHPIGCCLSMWKQHFARGQAFSYDLTDVSRYYRDYAVLMDHFEREMPGAVHRIYYEKMVADTEGEIRRLLDYLDLPFEESCLDFWKNERAVRTASSEQVRQPIFTDATGHWRNFEPWLGSMMEELGDEIERYPT